jgi:RNA polymerase II-associated factor 1
VTGAAPKGPNPTPDDEDLFLLGDAANAPVTASASSAVLMGERKKVDVSWLRRTEYLSSDAANKVTGGTGGLGYVQPPLTA